MKNKIIVVMLIVSSVLVINLSIPIVISSIVIDDSEPDLDCEGSLFWDEIVPGSTITGSFIVRNIGDAGSELDWEIADYPDFGHGCSWTFEPMEGLDLTPSDGDVIVNVTVVAPEIEETTFSGVVTVINQENCSDSDIIDVGLITPKTKHSTNQFFIQVVNQILQRFQVLERILTLYPLSINRKTPFLQNGDPH